MTYAILNLVLSWATYLEAQAELALALKKVMKFN
jgi:hypothetical protein